MPQTDLHGPRLDDQLKHSTDRVGEPPAPSVHREPADAVLDRRSELARVLAAVAYPASPADLLVVAERADADEELLQDLGRLSPDDRYDAFGEVWTALGGPDVDHPEPVASRATPTEPAEPAEPAETRPATPTATGATRYELEFDALLAPVARLFGVTREHAWVEVDDEHLEIRFGRWVLRTPLANVAGCEVTGPYRLAKVVGPPRISFADRGITFATSRRRGVCIRFHEPVPAALPHSILRHPAATVTVADPHALVHALGPASG